MRRGQQRGCLTDILCARLASVSATPNKDVYRTYTWEGGVVAFYNAIRPDMWTNITDARRSKFHTDKKPMAYVLSCWEKGTKTANVWVIPEPVVYEACESLSKERQPKKSITIFPRSQRFERWDESPNLKRYHLRLKLSEGEQEALNKAKPRKVKRTKRIKRGRKVARR